MKVREPNRAQGQSYGDEAERAHRLLLKGESEGLDVFIELYYPVLALMVIRLLNDKKLAEQLPIDAFIRLWHRRHEMGNAEDVKTFLFKSVLEGCRTASEHALDLPMHEHEQPFTALIEAMIADYLICSIKDYDRPTGTETGELDHTD
jgi:DNA-directed RNA polymerase specialized sigma24 family protein